jgi:apolipoprotein N-acyltransferase
MKKNILLALFSGLLLWTAWPPATYTTFFLFIGLAPMLVAVENIIHSMAKNKGALIFRITFLGFLVWNSLSVYWVYNPLKTVGAVVAIPITIVPYSLAPLLMAAAFWLYYRFRLVTNRTWGLVALVCFWIGYEYLNQTWDLKFPWMTLGNGFAISHQWVQWYSYTGVYGGTLWIWATNILAFLIYTGLSEAQPKTTRLKLITAFVLTILLPLALSLGMYYNYEEQKDPANIVLVQPNIDPYSDTSLPAYQQLDILTHLSDSLGQQNTEFFIWPETAIPDYINEDRIRTNNDFLAVQHFLYRFKNGNVLTGIQSYRLYNNRATATASPTQQSNLFIDNYNAAVNIENSAQVQFYHKSKFVPGVESLPFGDVLAFLKPAFEHLGGATGSYAGQPDAGVFYAQSGVGVDPVICYESIWGGYVAESVDKGAQFIAIITNDGWFGNSSGKDQHLDYAKLRAIETRRWVCQSANTGISAFINQRGDIEKQTKWWARTAIKDDINLNSSLTFYVKHGDYLAKAGSLLAVLGILWMMTRVRFRKKSMVSHSGSE